MSVSLKKGNCDQYIFQGKPQTKKEHYGYMRNMSRFKDDPLPSLQRQRQGERQTLQHLRRQQEDRLPNLQGYGPAIVFGVWRVMRFPHPA